MNRRDTDFLTGLFDTINESNETHKFVCVFRQGHLLSLLPMDKMHSIRALSLYQAQSFKARLYVTYLHLVLWFRAYFLVETVDLGAYREPYQFLSDSEHVGFLLGNPHSKNRKMLAYHCQGDVASVTKIALDKKTTISVKKEIEDLEKINLALTGASNIFNKYVSKDETHAYYTVDWVNGRAPNKRDNEALIELLKSWIISDEKVSLEETDVWKDIMKWTADTELASIVSEIGQSQVLLAGVHGDFTPWNIKFDKNHEVCVLDWESYHEDGIAGMDWAHYLVQSKFLVGKLWAHEVIEILIYWSKREEGVIALKKFGWEDKALEWIGCYLFYAHYKLGYDREELIQCWKEKKETF